MINIQNFKIKPTIIKEDIQDCLILKFGNPKTAIFAHLDTIGFTVGYGKELIKIGGPKTNDGIKLVGKDSKGILKQNYITMKMKTEIIILNIYLIER